MDEELDVEQGLKENFMGIMQKTYDYLDDCITSVEGCSVLVDLGFDNGSNAKIVKDIGNSKSEISGLLSNVGDSEDAILTLDLKSSNAIDSIPEDFKNTISVKSDSDFVENIHKRDYNI